MASHHDQRGGLLLLAVAVISSLLLSSCGNAGTPAAPPSPSGVAAAPSATAAEAANEPAKVLASLPAQPGGAGVQDANGVSLNLAAGSVPQDQKASLISSQLGSQTAKQINDNYQIDTAAYSVSAGSADSQPGAVLSFPAKSDAARLAVLIDGKYLGILDNPPQNGKLSVEAPIASPDVQDSPYPTAVKGSPAQFFVVTPKNESWQPAPNRHSGITLASYQQQSDDGKSCVSERWTLNHCWRNADKTIYIFWANDFPGDLKDIEYLRVVDTIKTISGIMAAYVQKGVTTANLTSSKPIYVVIQAALNAPNYVPSTRTLYLDWGFVSNSVTTANKCTISHELMHWIEHQKYYMIADYYSNYKAWWLDMAAELGSFMLNPDCIDRNLTTYGMVNTTNNLLGLQDTPFNWDRNEEARYIQALQAYISTCSGGASCAISPDDFINSINTGTFPFSSDQAQAAYQGNAKDMGLFLLGAAPQTSRTNAFIPPAAKSGNGYGDYLILKDGKAFGFEFGLSTDPFKQKNPQEVDVTASIKKGGVYPLWVANGKGAPIAMQPLPGLPGVLKVDAGTPFWVSVDGAAPQFYDGSKPFTLAPISAPLGKGLARIVAVAPDGDKTFKASLSLADFSGDWSTTISNQKVTPIDCKGNDGTGEAKPFDDSFLQIFSGFGTYELDPAAADGSHYIWKGTLPEGITGDSEIKFKDGQLVLTYHIDQPKKTAALFGIARMPPFVPGTKFAAPVPILSLALPALPILAWVMRRKKSAWQRRFILALVLAGLAVLLAGCFGMGIYGKLDATYTIQKAEYVDPQLAPAGKTDLTWNLTKASVKMNIDINIESTTTDSNGNDTTQTDRCAMTIDATAIGKIGPDGTVPAPKMGK